MSERLKNFKPQPVIPVDVYITNKGVSQKIGNGEFYDEYITLVEIPEADHHDIMSAWAVTQHKLNRFPHMLVGKDEDNGEGWRWKFISESMYNHLEEAIIMYKVEVDHNHELQAYTFIYTYLKFRFGLDLHKDFGIK